MLPTQKSKEPLINTQLIETVEKIERSGLPAIVKIDSVNQKISFSHQTLIDYLMAWKVINEGKTLLNFLMEHNQSLFIRPTLKHILGFLRMTSEKRLFSELNVLFFDNIVKKEIGFKDEKNGIQMHIKTAILADISSWDKPSEEETTFLLRIFKESVDSQTLILQFFNSQPNVDWFSALKDKYFLPILREKSDSDIEYRVILSFLGKMASFFPAEILDIAEILMEKQSNSNIEWFFRYVADEFDKMDVTSFQDRYVDFLEDVIRKKFTSWYYEIRTSCKQISKYSPKKGIELYIDFVKKELNADESKINSSQGSLTESYDEVVPVAYQQDPYYVLSSLTDFFEDILDKRYLGEKCLWDSPGELLFSNHADRFGLDAFYHWYKNKVLESCINLTNEAKGLIAKLESSKWNSQRQLSILAKIKNFLFYKEYLTSYLEEIFKKDLKEVDFSLHEIYLRILEKLFGILDEGQRQIFIDKILNLPFKDARDVKMWIWQGLHHIPVKFQNDTAKEVLNSITQRYDFEKQYKHRVRRRSMGGFQSIKSPVPLEILKGYTPEDLLKLLIDKNKLKDYWDFDKDIAWCGVEELARTVAQVFIENLDKYKRIIQQLSKNIDNDEYLVWLFYELPKGESHKRPEEWIIELINEVYKREKLEMSIARYIENIADNISSGDLQGLKKIIVYLSKSKDPEKDTFFEARSKGYGNDALGDGINRTRGVVPLIVVRLLERFKEEWLAEILLNLSNDPTISVRAALVRYLPYAIKSLGWEKCFEMFSNAFQKGPEEYAKIIPHFLQYVPKDKFDQIQSILEELKLNKKGHLGESLAGIMTIYYLRGLYSKEILLEILKDKDLNDKGRSESFNILANRVKSEAMVEKSLSIINDLLDQKDDFEWRISILFRDARIDDLEKFKPIIDKVLEKPQMMGDALYYMLEYLEKCLLNAPYEVFCLLEKILANLRDEYFDIQNFIPASRSKAPINIVNTILECYPEHENRGMAALDKLIEIGWEGVKDYLHGFDRG